MKFLTLDLVDVSHQRVLIRADLNVPMKNGEVRDLTRLERLTPTMRELSLKGARIIVISHFGRPEGKPVGSMSLRPVAQALAKVLGHAVKFAGDCIGAQAEEAVKQLQPGEILVLENTRFYPGEEENDQVMAGKLADMADLYVNDAFSVSHRAHASTEGVAHLLPCFAGRLMQHELDALGAILEHPARPMAALVGGAKVSSKLGLLQNLLPKIDLLVVGGAMANTFLAAQGHEVGGSLQEPGMHDAARNLLARARAMGCEVLLPVDALIGGDQTPDQPVRVANVDAIPSDAMILDIGPASVAAILSKLSGMRSLIWNGPLGAFETPPFDQGTSAVARAVAVATKSGALRSVAGGGDTVAALHHAGVLEEFTYVSAAGGAFLEWLEGRTLPGVQALIEGADRRQLAGPLKN